MDEVLDTAALQWPKSPPKKIDAIDDKSSTYEDTAITIDVLNNDKNALGVYKIFENNKISDATVAYPDGP